MNIIESTADFSECRRWRYALHRTFDTGIGRLVGCGLNPSTADETVPDNTITRMLKIAEREGFGSFTMLNLFGWRDKNPKIMKRQVDPVGRQNDEWIRSICMMTAKFVVCWGTDGKWMGRDEKVLEIMRSYSSSPAPIHCFGKNKDGTPKHPLYLRSDVQLELYQ